MLGWLPGDKPRMGCTEGIGRWSVNLELQSLCLPHLCQFGLQILQRLAAVLLIRICRASSQNKTWILV